jgi:hypothetical protein
LYLDDNTHSESVQFEDAIVITGRFEGQGYPHSQSSGLVTPTILANEALLYVLKEVGLRYDLCGIGYG